MKYASLKAYLAAQSEDRLALSFGQVAAAAKAKLPASAYRYAQWWQNDPLSHVQAKAWIEAGYETAHVDMEAQRLVFVRATKKARGVQEMRTPFEPPAAPVDMHPMIGAMKGTFTISPEWDVTKPALDPEELAEWEASIDRKFDRAAAGPNGKK